MLLAVCALGCDRLVGIEELRFDDAGGAGASADSGAGAGDVPKSRPSCETVEPRCGSERDDDCCASLRVPGGEFQRQAGHPARVSAFELDKYEVTVARFRAFVEAGFGTQANPPEADAAAHPAITGSGWDPNWNRMLPETSAGLAEEVRCNDTILLYTSRPDSHDERPMNCLSWPLAFAFCVWDGARLPTEAEWAFAAAGGAEQRPYPWGNAAPDAERASFGCNARGGSDCVLEDVLSVGQLPKGAGRWRHLDLAGNMGEWVLDSAIEYPLPCDDCAALGATFGDRTYRGGTFDDLAAKLANGVRGDGPATAHGRDIGVRCARDVAD